MKALLKKRFAIRIWKFELAYHYNKSMDQLHITIGKRYFRTPTIDKNGICNGYKFFELKYY